MSDTPPHQPLPEPSERTRIFNAPPGTLWLSGILIAMFLAVRFGPRAFEEQAFDLLAFVPLAFNNALQGTGPGPFAALLPLLGHAFLHFDWMHLVLNVGFLLAFGSVVERHFGLWWFLLLFALTAAAGALLQYSVEPHSPIHMIGASGAVYGMMGGAIPPLLAGRGRWRLGNAITFIAVMMLLNLVIGIIGNSSMVFGAAIAWQAHVGGFVAGFLLCYLWEKLRRPRPEV